MWKDFNTKFGGILKRLARHKNFLENSVQIAQFQLYQDDLADTKRASLIRFQEYQHDVVELNVKLDKLVAEEQEHKLRVVIQWLAVGQQSQQDHDIYRQIRSDYSTTTHWIVQNEHIKQWLDDAAVPPTPVLWMHGIPGAGTS